MSGDEGRWAPSGHVTPASVPQPGTRVVVRYRLAAPDPRTGARLTDAVGELESVDPQSLVVRTRRGPVRVETAAVELVKEVPPRPGRRGAPHRALTIDDLQRVMLGAWPAIETARLGDWVLRASEGFTNRGNSVMTAGSPGRPIPDAVDAVERWYADRGLPSNLTLAGPVGFDPAEDPLGSELLGRGYVPRVMTRTLTAAAAEVGRTVGPPPPGVDVSCAEVLADEWLDAYRGYRTVDDEAARAVLTGSPAQDFAQALDGGRVVGIGRLGVASAWGGIAAMWVDPEVRRRGIAGALLGELSARAGARGIRSLHLQTDTDNVAALALYAAHGFSPHHDYVNLRRVDGRG